MNLPPLAGSLPAYGVLVNLPPLAGSLPAYGVLVNLLEEASLPASLRAFARSLAGFSGTLVVAFALGAAVVVAFWLD